MSLAPGTRLGPYEVLGLVGTGGMGAVYRARDTRLGRDVAVKVLSPELSADPDSSAPRQEADSGSPRARSRGSRRARFEREARAVAALNHPNILTIHDVGTDGGTLYLVTELLEGGTFRDLLLRPLLSQQEVLSVAKQVAQGLAAAHSRGIVHRDLKPENLFLTHDGRVKILDFGLARLTGTRTGADASTTRATEPGVLMGTLAYMSPQQVQGRPAGPASDVFSFGVVLYELLTGRHPFWRGTAAATLNAILHETPPLPSSVSSTAAPGLDDVVRRCLAKDEKERFASGADVARALETGLQAGEQPAVAGTASERRTAMAVALFENFTGDASLDLLGLMVADWITDGLTQIATADVALPPSSALGAAGATDPGLRAAYANPQKVAAATGAAVVVSGAYYLDGEDLVCRARLSEPGSRRLLATIDPVRGPRARQSEVLDAARRAVVSAVAFHLDTHFQLRSGRPPSLEAYREMSQAMAVWYRDWDAVIRHLERAVALDPEYASPRVHLALARFFCGDFQSAQQDIDAAQALEGRVTEYERQEIRYVRAHLAGQTWEYLAAAREQMRLAPGVVSTGGGAYDAAVMPYALNRPMEASGLLATLSSQETVFGWAVPEIRSHALHAAGGFDEQFTVASRAREQYPTILYFHEHQAAALAAMGDLGLLERVIAETLQAQAESGTAGLVMLVAAMELRAHGHRPEADAMAARAADWYARQRLGTFVALQTPNRGVEWYRARPPDIRNRLREEHAMALGWAGRWDQARSLVGQLREEAPENVDYLGWHGVLAARRGDTGEARGVADRLRTLSPQYLFGSHTYWRACVAAQLGEMEQAVNLLTQAFSEGYWYQTQLHRTIDLEPLWDYPAFRELMRPKG